MISAERAASMALSSRVLAPIVLRRVVGALADVLADRGEGFGDDVGARHELGFGLRDLLVELLGHRFGAVGEPAFDFGDLDVDAVAAA